MDPEVDVLFAKRRGWLDIEHTDYGAIVGRRPDGTIQYVPSPSSNRRDFEDLMEYMLERYERITLIRNSDSNMYEVIVNGNALYIAADLKSAVLRAFLGEELNG